MLGNSRMLPTQKKGVNSDGKNLESGRFPGFDFVSLQYGLRLGVNGPLFGRKPLDYLYEQVIRSVSDKARNRVGPQFQKIYYSEPYTGSDCHFHKPVFGFFEYRVPPHKKYCLKWVFPQNNPFNRDFSLQFIGVLLVTFIGTYFTWFFGRNGVQMPLVDMYRIHVGELNVLKGFCGII